MLYRKFIAKRLLVCTLIVHGAFLFLFTLISPSYALLLIIRFLLGFSQIILYLYLPAWIDLRASGEKQKTFMMSILLYVGALGVIIGYFTAGQIVSSGRTWKWAYYTQMFATLLICLALIPISIRSLDLKIAEITY